MSNVYVETKDGCVTAEDDSGTVFIYVDGELRKIVTATAVFEKGADGKLYPAVKFQVMEP